MLLSLLLLLLKYDLISSRKLPKNKLLILHEKLEHEFLTLIIIMIVIIINCIIIIIIIIFIIIDYHHQLFFRVDKYL